MDLRPSTLLQRLGIAPEHTEPAPGLEDQDDAEPQPEPEPTAAPAAAAPGRRGDRLPDWWAPKPELGADAAGEGTPTAPPAKECQHLNPHAVRAHPTGQLVAYWCLDCDTQMTVPDDYDELDDITGDEDGDDGGEGGEERRIVDKVPAAIRQHWEQFCGTGSKSYSRPAYPTQLASPKKSLIDAWAGMSPKLKHLLYNGTALGVGFWFGVPQWFTAEVAYLAATYDSWTDFYVCIWYGVAGAVWALDHRTRRWFPLFAWGARIPLVSMITGVLLYGIPA